MIAHVDPARIRPGGAAAATVILREHGLPALRRARGVRAGLWLHDPATDESLRVTVWDYEVTDGAPDSAP